MSANKQAAVPPAPTFSPELLAKLAKTDPYAVEALADCAGPLVFNPIIGGDPADTFTNLADVLNLVHEITIVDHNFCEQSHGMSLLLQCAWSAAQYEAFRAQKAAEAQIGKGGAA